MMMRTPLEERFWAKVKKTRTCWLWAGAVGGHGYGNITSGGHIGKTLRAHRVAYALLVGNLPEGVLLDHVCHNKLCVNPAHLRVATPAQNLFNTNLRKDSRSGCKGVRRHGRGWQARLGGKTLGTFPTFKEAQTVYRDAAKLAHGAFYC